MSNKRICALFVTIIGFASQANAAKMTVRETACPFGEDSVRVFELMSDNMTGGYDSDLAAYSSGQQFRRHAISTCYENLFSFYGKDIQIKVEPTQTQPILNAIAVTQKGFDDPKNPEVWERYALANAIYGALDRPFYVRAKIMLEASWTIRDTIVGFHRGLNGPESVKQIFQAAAKELKKDLSPQNKKLLLYNLARVAHRGGYPGWRDHYLNAFLALPTLSEEDKQSAETFKHVAQTLEPLYQRQAIALFKQALTEKLSQTNREKALFLIADLNRRLGNHKEALQGYRKVADMATDNQLQTLSNFFIENDLRMELNSK